MGGRGGASGGGSRYASSTDYKKAYDIEMENARDFEAAGNAKSKRRGGRWM